MKKVFLSYKREDEKTARDLHGHIVSWGFNCWLDVLHLSPGERWDTTIDQELKSSDAVVGLITSQSLKSENVLDEWGYALSSGKKLFLLKIADFAIEDIPFNYSRIQRIDITKDKEIGLETLRQMLLYDVSQLQAKVQIKLTQQQKQLLIDVLSRAGNSSLGKKFYLKRNNSEKSFEFNNIAIISDISDSDLMALARQGFIKIYVTESTVIFTDKLLHI